MDKLKYIKLELADGSYTNSIPIAVDADQVSTSGGSNLATDLVQINNTNSTQQTQINNLQSEVSDSGIKTLKADTTEEDVNLYLEDIAAGIYVVKITGDNDIWLNYPTKLVSRSDKTQNNYDHLILSDGDILQFYKTGEDLDYDSFVRHIKNWESEIINLQLVDVNYENDAKLFEWKIREITPVEDSFVHNSSNGYSSYYLNNHILNVSNEVDEDYRVNFIKGKNLLPKMGTKTINGITITEQSDGSLILNGTATANVSYYYCGNDSTYTSFSGLETGGTFTLSSTSVDGYAIYIMSGGSVLSSILNGGSNTFTATANSSYRIFIRVNSGTSVSNIHIYPQLEKGSTATTYEAFIPNSVSVDNEKFTETVGVGSSINSANRVNFIKGRNLFNINDITPNNFLDSNTGNISSSTSWSTSNYIEVSSSTSYVLNYVRSGTSNTTICFYDSSKAFISSTSTSTLGLPATFTTPSNAKYLRFDYRSADNQTNIQLEKGTTPTSFESYIPSSIYVDNEKFTETLGVGTSVDSRNRVNVLHSKNLLNYTIPLTTNLGVTTSMSDGKLILDGTTTGNGDFIYTNSKNILLLKAGTYTISATRISGTYQKNNKDTAIYIRKAGDETVLFDLTSVTNYSRATTIKLTEDTLIKLNIYTNGSGMVFTNLVVNLQIERGSTATDFEIPVIPSINVDGEEIYTKGQNEEYSTNETRIGTWIDGKPLYRKVFSFSNPEHASNLGNSGITPANVTKIDALGTQANNNVGGRLPIGYNGFGVQINSNGAFYYTNPNYTFSNLTIIVEYTKTTD